MVRACVRRDAIASLGGSSLLMLCVGAEYDDDYGDDYDVNSPEAST